ncbi:MAG: N-6 DNA methylase, partial [Desulfobacteraceae bacterium]
ERVAETVRLNKMNLAVHGLAGDIRQGNTYYEDLHRSTGKFDFVMANPPFNVDRVDKDRLKDDPRFPLGLPRADNANYLWIQLFYSALNEHGRAGFVMANSAADARGSELDIRRQLIEARAVDAMVSVGSNFFYTVTLPCTLWFLDRGKKDTDRADKVLFIDARDIYRQVDRAHREFRPKQVEFLSNIVRLYRGEDPEDLLDGGAMLAEKFTDGPYQDVPGLCKVATIKEIKAQGWSLNPGRYVAVADREEEDFDLKERLGELNEELELTIKDKKQVKKTARELLETFIRAQGFVTSDHGPEIRSRGFTCGAEVEVADQKGREQEEERYMDGVRGLERFHHVDDALALGPFP